MYAISLWVVNPKQAYDDTNELVKGGLVGDSIRVIACLFDVAIDRVQIIEDSANAWPKGKGENGKEFEQQHFR